MVSARPAGQIGAMAPGTLVEGTKPVGASGSQGSSHGAPAKIAACGVVMVPNAQRSACSM